MMLWWWPKTFSVWAMVRPLVVVDVANGIRVQLKTQSEWVLSYYYYYYYYYSYHYDSSDSDGGSKGCCVVVVVVDTNVMVVIVVVVVIVESNAAIRFVVGPWH